MEPGVFITSCTVPQKTKEPPVSTEEPPAPPLSSVVTQESVTTEEAVTDEEQVSQMDKSQISDTYRLLTDTFSSGSFYLEYILRLKIEQLKILIETRTIKLL